MIIKLKDFKQIYENNTSKINIASTVLKTDEYKTISYKVRSAYNNWITSGFNDEELFKLNYIIKKIYTVTHDFRRVKKDLRILDIINSDTVDENMSIANITKIGKITKDVKIELDLSHSMHSLERQGRSGKYIKNADIKELVENTTEQIIDALIVDNIDIDDKVLLYDSQTHLNVVGALNKSKIENVIQFKVITCMFSDNFYNKDKTFKITI